MTILRAVPRIGLVVVSVCLVLPAGLAGDFYVDALAGDDANGGSSWQDAWRTLTHASQHVGDPPPGQRHTFHVAPGVYARSGGETFPIRMRPGRRFVGAGSRTTLVDGEGAQLPLFEHEAVATLHPGPELEGLGLRDASHGVRVRPALATNVALRLRDVEVLDMSQVGVLAAVEADGDALALQLDRVTVRRSGLAGLRVVGGARFVVLSIAVRDSVFSDNHGTGVDLRSAGPTAYESFLLERCRIERNEDGLRARGGTGCCQGIRVRDSAVVANRAHGVTVATGLYGVHLDGCTVAGNHLAGLQIVPGVPALSTLTGTILYGNGDDVDLAPNAFVDVSYGLVGDGDFAGAAGNLSGNPRFVDLAGGDVRLRWTSPCVDAGPPQVALGRLDLARIERPVDGDLDTVERADVGALELAPLRLRGDLRLGGEIVLELWGPSGADVEIWRAPSAPVAPMGTPFGQMDLDPSQAAPWQLGDAAPWPPGTLVRPIGTGPALLGRTFSFQALVDSSAAPQGRAWTNAVTFTLEQ